MSDAFAMLFGTEIQQCFFAIPSRPCTQLIRQSEGGQPAYVVWHTFDGHTHKVYVKFNCRIHLRIAYSAFYRESRYRWFQLKSVWKSDWFLFLFFLVLKHLIFGEVVCGWWFLVKSGWGFSVTCLAYLGFGWFIYHGIFNISLICIGKVDFVMDIGRAIENSKHARCVYFKSETKCLHMYLWSFNKYERMIWFLAYKINKNLVCTIKPQYGRR